jgi:CubicO group peptidase (beta-lactamase class C family)
MKAVIALLVSAAGLAAGPLYFPGEAGDWERIELAAAGWDAAKLEAALDFARERRSSGVVILLDGKILVERNWDRGSIQGGSGYGSRQTPDGRAIEDVASVQKSVTSTLMAVALTKKLVSLDDTVAKHLGSGWSKASPEQEQSITLRHLVTMTSGLSDELAFEAPAGSKWRYNTPAYQLTMRVLAAASGLTPNDLTEQWLTGRIGMRETRWIERPAMPGLLGLASTARDLARFGLLIQAGGKWAGKTIIENPEYLRAMLDSSQQLNPAYGYLWWLNGRRVVRAAGQEEAALIPSAPKDLVAALGALGRKIYVVPSMGLVVTRIGANAQERGEPSFDDELWKRLMAAAPKSR